MMQTAVACSATAGNAKELGLIVWQQAPAISVVFALVLRPSLPRA